MAKPFSIELWRMARLHRLAISFLWVVVLSGCGTVQHSTVKPCVSATATDELSADNSVLVQSLRRQLSEKELHITQLQSRLTALKLIEEDRQKRRKFGQRRATIIPPE